MSEIQILLVENHRKWQEILAMHIHQALPSADVVIAARFQEANVQLAQGEWRLLVTDIGLPPDNEHVLGMQLVKLAREMNVPCIVVSGTEAMTNQLVADATTKYNARFFSKQQLSSDPNRQTEFQQQIRDFAAVGGRTRATPAAANRETIFISYSHHDKRWLKELQTHLKPYLRDDSVKAWSDDQIRPGSEWSPQIRGALSKTKVAVFLVTPDFLASDFIHDHELSPLIKEAVAGGVQILWIPVQASSYEKSPINGYQAIGDPQFPLAGMTRNQRAAAWVKICQAIEKAVERC